VMTNVLIEKISAISAQIRARLFILWSSTVANRMATGVPRKIKQCQIKSKERFLSSLATRLIFPHKIKHTKEELVMEYVDGFSAAVPSKNKEQYIRHAKEAAVVFKEYGAIRLVECWGDDVPDGDKTSFPLAVQCKEDETVVFSWIVWPSKAVRNTGMKKVMEDPRMSSENNPMPFDSERLIYGGFQVIVSE